MTNFEIEALLNEALESGHKEIVEAMKEAPPRRLINAEAMRKKLSEGTAEIKLSEGTSEIGIAPLQESLIRAIDALERTKRKTEVVQCKDCAYYTKHYWCGRASANGVYIKMPADGYCSFAINVKAVDAEELKSLIRKYEMVHIDNMNKLSRAIHKSVIHEVIEDIMLCIDVSDSVPVAVVKCKDCKWFGNRGCAIEIRDESDKPKEYDFCSFGEVKDDDE